MLVAGGHNLNGSLTSAEIYDPASGRWSSTGSLRHDREDAKLVLLPNGQALIAGGYEANFGRFLSSAELYDPVTGSWSTTASMLLVRDSFTMNLLPTGEVLVAGGESDGGTVAEAELYDPAAGKWTRTAPMANARRAILRLFCLTDESSSRADKAPVKMSGRWKSTIRFRKPGPVVECRRAPVWHAATLLDSAEILLSGGKGPGQAHVLNACELGGGF